MSESTTNVIGWGLGAIATIGGVLATVIATLARKIESDNAKRIEKLDAQVEEMRLETEDCQKARSDCERDRAVLFAKCEMNERQIAELKLHINSMDTNGTQYSHKLDKRERD